MKGIGGVLKMNNLAQDMMLVVGNRDLRRKVEELERSLDELRKARDYWRNETNELRRTLIREREARSKEEYSRQINAMLKGNPR